MLLTLGLSTALAAPLTFQRVDLLSEDYGTWINYETPGLLNYPTRGFVRWAGQVKVVLDLPRPNLSLGISMASQSLTYENVLHEPSGFLWHCGLQTQLLVPKALNLGLAWKWDRYRVGLGLSALSGASWSSLSWDSWTVLPTFGFGVGRPFKRN